MDGVGVCDGWMGWECVMDGVCDGRMGGSVEDVGWDGWMDGVGVCGRMDGVGVCDGWMGWECVTDGWGGSV